MRVAIVQEHVQTGRGGAETSTVEMARELAALELDVSIVCCGDRDQPFVADNVSYLPIAVGGAGRALRTYRFVQAAQRFLRSERFDVIHAITPCLSATVYQPRGGTYRETVARTLARTPPALRGIKWLGRRFNIRQRFLARLEELLLNKHQDRVHVAAVSDYVRRQVIAFDRFPDNRVRVVYNGVHVDPLPEAESREQRVALRTALGLGETASLALFVAHNFKLKGLAELLRAVASARQHAWHVAVLGRDDPRPFEKLARRLAITKRVHFAGAQLSINTWYAAADLLAHPTWYDPCSRVVLEALCAGLPVVTTRYNGAAEVMQPPRHGEVVSEPDDIDALGRAIAATLQPGVRESCRAAAPGMRQWLSMARHARELKQMYEEIVSRG